MRLGPVVGGIWPFALFVCNLLLVVRMLLPSLGMTLGVPTVPRSRGGRLALGGCTLTSLAIVALTVLLVLLPDRTNGGVGLELVGAMLVGLAVAAFVAPLAALNDTDRRQRWRADVEGGSNPMGRRG